MGPLFGLVMLGAMFYGAYVLVRVIIALAKKQEMKPWLLKLGASFVVFVIAGAGVGASSGGSSGGSYVTSDKQGNAVTTTSAPQTTSSPQQTTPVQQKTPEELEQERIAREEEAALQKKYDDQKKYEEWIEWKKQEAEKQAQKAEEERKAQEAQRRKEQERRRQEENKYQAINISSLLNEIRSNAARAKHNFNGKYLKMEGLVLTIESDGDNVVISDGEYNLMPAVHCMPSRNNKTVREKIFRLNKGQYVTVYGKVTNIGESIGCYFELEKIQ